MTHRAKILILKGIAWVMTFFWLIITILIILTCCKVLFAEEIPDNLAVRAIVGEASGEGYYGMLDIASAIRARGSLRGVYGLNASHIDKETKKTWELALKAWKTSKYSPTHKGGYWGSIKCDKKWLAKMESDKRYVKVYSRGNHIFYKKIRKQNAKHAKK